MKKIIEKKQIRKKKLETKPFYLCPHCKNKQTTVISWETQSVAYKFQLENGESDQVDIVGGERESWACPKCSMGLPLKIVQKIEKMLKW